MGDEIGAYQVPAYFRAEGGAGVGQPAGADFVAVAAVLNKPLNVPKASRKIRSANGRSVSRNGRTRMFIKKLILPKTIVVS